MILNRKFLYDNSMGDEIIFALDSNFILNSIEGISSNGIDISSSDSVNQVGSTINYKHVKDKNITINGTIKKNTEANREKLLNVILPRDNAKLYCILDDGSKYYLDVTPATTPIIENIDYGAKFQFVLNCPYPFWKTVSDDLTILNGIQPMFRFSRNFSGTWQVGSSIVSEFINVRNEGNQGVGMDITLKATSKCSGFKVQNVKTLEYIYLEYEMQAGEEVTITTEYNNKRIISSINGNIIRYLDLLNSVFLQLKSGDNIFKFTANFNEDGVEVSITHNTVKAGL